MSEPIPDIPAGPPRDLIAAQALVDLVQLLHTDPLARPLLGHGASMNTPWFYVFRGQLHLDLHMPAAGVEQVAAATALFGDTFTVDDLRSTSDYVKHAMNITWRGVPFQVQVDVAREDELAAAQKRIAELEAAEARRRARLDEQRHQFLDPPVPPLAYVTAAAAVSGVTA